jgi:hypothetical protein
VQGAAGGVLHVIDEVSGQQPAIPHNITNTTVTLNRYAVAVLDFPS